MQSSCSPWQASPSPGPGGSSWDRILTAGNTAQLGGFGVKTFETEEAVTVCDYYPGWPGLGGEEEVSRP